MDFQPTTQGGLVTLLASFLGPDALNMAALLAVVFIGLPHGAMDGALAMHFGWLNRPSKAVVFLLSYVGLALLVVGFWMVAPVLVFVAFLAISLLHFGRGDSTSHSAGQERIESLARGGLVIAGISQAHRGEANEVFLTIVGSSTGMVWAFLDVMMVVTVVSIVVVLAFKHQKDRMEFLIEMAFLSAVFILTAPLVGFAIYFCFIHSFRHFTAMRSLLTPTVSKLRITQTTLVFSLLTWGAGLFMFSQQSASIGVEPALLRVVFIGLAALTVPHMILIDGILEQKSVQKTAA